MFLRIHRFYVSRSPLQQLLLLYLLNTVFWFLAWSFYTWYFNEAQRSFVYRLLHAAWMSLVITIPLNWRKVKQLLSK